MGQVTAGVGVSPHFFRQHRLEKNAVLTPTPAVTDQMQRTTRKMLSGWPLSARLCALMGKNAAAILENSGPEDE